MTCEVCDREGCPAQSFKITDDESAACSAILKFRGRVEDDVRDLARAASRRCAEADRDCAAHAVHAVVWRDLAIAARAREAALTAEVERLRAEVEVERVGNVWRKMAGDATDLAQDIADEAFGPFETQGPIESLRAIERGIAGLNEDLAAARADAANARAVATEAIDDLSHGVDCDRRRDNDGVVRGCNCYLATLRARLASPEPGADGAKET